MPRQCFQQQSTCGLWLQPQSDDGHLPASVLPRFQWECRRGALCWVEAAERKSGRAPRSLSATGAWFLWDTRSPFVLASTGERLFPYLLRQLCHQFCDRLLVGRSLRLRSGGEFCGSMEFRGAQYLVQCYSGCVCEVFLDEINVACVD